MTKHTKRLTDLQKIEICKLYETKNYTFKKLSLLYNITASGIAGILKRRGYKSLGNSITNRKYSVNDDFFNEVNSEKTAYYLGWLYSDGNLIKNKYSGCITIAICEDDEEILHKLKNCIQYTGPILHRKRDINWKGSFKNSKPSSVLSITNVKIAENVEKLGIFPNKTNFVKFPTKNQVPLEFLPHFIRGYLDGDGSIYKKAKNRKDWILSFDGTKEFLEELIKYFQTINPNVKSKIQKRHKEKKNNTYNVKFSIPMNIDIINKLYENSTIFLERKHNKYLQAIAPLNKVKKESEFRETP